MTLDDLGYNPTFEAFRKNNGLDSLLVGRVISEHRERYVVKNDEGEFESELLGNLRFTAESKSDLPAVGDWVAISEYDEGKALIHSVFPRYSILERQAVGKFGEKQIVATNIDYGIVVQSINRDFSINRLERYLTLCYASDIIPIIAITKIDLEDKSKVSSLIEQVKGRMDKVLVFAISNTTGEGLEEFKKSIQKGKTYCLLGSSGVGKSSLINSLSGEKVMQTGEISEGIDRGKHITTFRQLIPLINGGILIDNPGMREVGITDNAEGLETTFEDIVELAKDCKFKDCTHTTEVGCAVLEAIENGEIDQSQYDNYQKMQREQAFFTSTVAERRKKDKDFGKMIKTIQKNTGKNRT